MSDISPAVKQSVLLLVILLSSCVYRLTRVWRFYLIARKLFYSFNWLWCGYSSNVIHRHATKV